MATLFRRQLRPRRPRTADLLVRLGLAPPGVSGSSATTNANDTSSASGTTTVVGTLARTNANDTANASGSAGSVSGTVAVTNANDTSSASGWEGTITGTVAVTNANDTSASVLIEFSTGAVFYIPFRFVSGVYQSGIVSTSSRATSWLPAPTTPLGYVNAQGQVIVYPVWRQFLEALSDRLGGAEGPRVPDVATSVLTTQAAAIQATAQVAAVAQQSQANAEALAATVEVVTNNALVGAEQIPDVVLSNYEVLV